MQTPEMITFHCPNCSMKLQVPSQMAGVTGPCPQCSASISAPQPSIQPIATAPLPPQQVQQAIQQPVQQQAQQQQPLAQNPQHPLQQNRTPQAGENPAARAERPNAERPLQESPVARERARQRDGQPQQKPQPQSQSKQKPRARWMRVIFPLAFLIVAVALVLAVLQAVGVFNVWDLEANTNCLHFFSRNSFSITSCPILRSRWPPLFS
jgi:hypothetical protein